MRSRTKLPASVVNPYYLLRPARPIGKARIYYYIYKFCVVIFYCDIIYLVPIAVITRRAVELTVGVVRW